MKDGAVGTGTSIPRGREEARQRTIIEALAGIYSYTAYVDLETMTFEKLAGDDSISEKVGRRGPVSAATEMYVSSMVHPDYRETVLKFLDASTLKERLAGRETVSAEFMTSQFGWYRGTILVAGRDEDGAPAGGVLCLQSITGEKTRETELLSRISSFSEKAYFDPVTGVRNRRYFDDNMKSVAASYAVAMLDMDNFMEIIEAYGAAVGDMVLRQIAREMLGCLRQEDVVIHHGDDIFIIGFGEGPESEIADRLEKIRRSVETMNIPRCPGIHVTVSIGCAFQSDFPNIFLAADKMLYRAKQTKNFVAV